MLPFPQINPVALSIGPLSVRWYGLMYLFGFVSGWFLGRRRVRTHKTFTLHDFDDLLTWALFGVIVGARLGYVLFYDLAAYIEDPLAIFYLTRGGMSFHGGMLGVIFATWLCAYRKGIPLFRVTDFFAPLVPPGLFFGRIGNFINGELWGRVTDAPIGMIFPEGGPLPRHPSQLYEAALEGVLFFILLWVYSGKPRPRMAVSGMFLLLYGMFRFTVEYFREPDAHLGLVGFGQLSMGQMLCLPMILGGIALLFAARTVNITETPVDDIHATPEGKDAGKGPSQKKGKARRR
ncbi:prolipoprotein diacylglyceryl transferase [Desulfovibrio sp. OttesenSCG-928-I05]|nr:prolipoprotein diacylglyceryl transferase [Desulfovibrio sp. OttesenSCG-928-I05]